MKLNECLQMAWEIVNDSYRLDLPLVHPPYLLAIAAIYITCNFQEKEYRTWFKTLNVEQEKVRQARRNACTVHPITTKQKVALHSCGLLM